MSVINLIERGALKVVIKPGNPDVNITYQSARTYEPELLRLARLGQRRQWVPVTEGLPEELNDDGMPKPVLCTDGNNVYKGYYAGHLQINCEFAGYEGDAEYDKETESHYWPEGWYECASQHEDIDWALGVTITHWMPIPDLPC